MGFILPYLNIDKYGYGLSNVYVSVGNNQQVIKKVCADYGCQTVNMSGSFDVWPSFADRLQNKFPLASYQVSSNVDASEASPYGVLYNHLVKVFPVHSNVFP